MFLYAFLFCASVSTQRRHHGALEILVVLYCIVLAYLFLSVCLIFVCYGWRLSCLKLKKLEKVAISDALPFKLSAPGRSVVLRCNHEARNAPTHQISAQSGSAWPKLTDDSTYFPARFSSRNFVAPSSQT